MFDKFKFSKNKESEVVDEVSNVVQKENPPTVNKNSSEESIGELISKIEKLSESGRPFADSIITMSHSLSKESQIELSEIVETLSVSNKKEGEATTFTFVDGSKVTNSESDVNAFKRVKKQKNGLDDIVKKIESSPLIETIAPDSIEVQELQKEQEEKQKPLEIMATEDPVKEEEKVEVKEKVEIEAKVEEVSVAENEMVKELEMETSTVENKEEVKTAPVKKSRFKQKSN